jgi:hypothetical protein
MSQVLITIKKNGAAGGPTVQFKTQGVPGGDCRIASEPYEKAAAAQVISDTPTDEMNQLPIAEAVNEVTN